MATTFSPKSGPGGKRRTKSRYGYQMVEKKTLKEIFGIREGQLRRYYQEAYRSKGATGSVLVSLLERRLDNAVFRAGFAATRPAARQMVSHGFFLVNGRRVTIASYRLTPGDVVSVKDTKRSKVPLSTFPKSLQNVQPPSWITLDPEQYAFHIKGVPASEDSNLGIDVQAITEFLSR